MGLFFKKKPVEEFECVSCKRKFSRPELGAVLGTDGPCFYFSGTRDNAVIQKDDDCVCASCAPKLRAGAYMHEKSAKGEALTVNDLQFLENLWRAEMDDMISLEQTKEKNKPLPANTVRYSSVKLTADKHLSLEVCCPKCFQQQNLVTAEIHNDKDNYAGLLELYMRLHPQLQWKCPSCGFDFTISK